MNTVQNIWKEYRLKVYETSEPLPQMQERECSLAFYAGMMAAFNVVSEISNANDADEHTAATALEMFLQDIDRAAARSNLDRSTGMS